MSKKPHSLIVPVMRELRSGTIAGTLADKIEGFVDPTEEELRIEAEAMIEEFEMANQGRLPLSFAEWFNWYNPIAAIAAE
jgi:hypothetical protein